MSKLRRMVLIAAALAALAVGGAAFAQAQNDSSPPAPARQGTGNATPDTDPGQSADTDGPDHAEGAREQARSASVSGDSGSDGHESNDAVSGHEVEDGD